MKDPETIRLEVGKFNTDVLSGWETGLRSKIRIGRKLFSRSPPEHLFEKHNISRLEDWLRGRNAAERYKQFHLQKTMFAIGTDAESKSVQKRYSGWNAKRGHVVTLLEKLGCAGDVYFFYYQGSVLKRQHKCGI